MAQNEDQAPNRDLAINAIGHLLADYWTPDDGLEDELRHLVKIFGSCPYTAPLTEHFCFILRLRVGSVFGCEDTTFFHTCHDDFHELEDHKPFTRALSEPHETIRRTLIFIDAKWRSQADPSPFPLFSLPLELRELVYYWALYHDEREICLQTPDMSFLDIHETPTMAVQDINTPLLRANRQIHKEAEPILYKSRSFDFYIFLREGLNFLQKLSSRARAHITSVSMELRFLLYQRDDPDWDPSNNFVEQWGKLCRYISQNLHVSEVSFDVLVRGVPRDFKNEQWVKDFVQIQGLSRLSQRAGFMDAHRWRMCKDGEGEVEPNNILHMRLQALLAYLNSEMLRGDLTQPEPGVWDYDHDYPASICLRDDEEPRW